MRAVVWLCALAACGGADSSAKSDGGDPVTMGEMFVAQRGCPACHQAPDGTLSGNLTPIKGTMSYPANLTPDHDTGIGDWSDDQIERAILHGIDDQGVPLCPPMPHFDGSYGGDGRPMSDDEARAIIAYLRSLPPVMKEIPESVCAAKEAPDLSMMEELDLSVMEESD